MNKNFHNTSAFAYQTFRDTSTNVNAAQYAMHLPENTLYFYGGHYKVAVDIEIFNMLEGIYE